MFSHIFLVYTMSSWWLFGGISRHEISLCLFIFFFFRCFVLRLSDELPFQQSHERTFREGVTMAEEMA